MIREGEIPDFIEDTAGELTDGSDLSPAPLLLGYALPTSFLTNSDRKPSGS
jgi:hypothetical protein